MAIQRAIMKGQLAGIVETRNVFTCDLVVTGGDTSSVLWNAYLYNIYTNVNGIMSTVWQTYEYEVRIPVAGQWELFYTAAFDMAGEQTGDYLPNAVAAVLIGAAQGIREYGRKFFSGIAESFSLGNALTSAGLAIVANALEAYITPFTGIGGGTITPGVVDKNGDFHPFVGGVVSSLLGSMRRRKPGIGM